jgi:hypothetical protein
MQPAKRGDALDSALYFLRYLNTRAVWAKKKGCLPPEAPLGGVSSLEPPRTNNADVIAVSVPMPGTFLVAHPLLGDYFKRSVVFIVGSE